MNTKLYFNLISLSMFIKVIPDNSLVPPPVLPLNSEL